jgi:hypothetical protein
MSLPQVIAKFASGRFCLAMLAGAVFVIATINGQLDAKDIMLILAIVFQSYFNTKEPTHG